jgi:spermidine synthase
MAWFDTSDWCLIPGALVSEPGILWLREPACANRSELVELLRSGRYDKPFVSDDGEMRRLHFSLGFTQSEMSLGEPDALTLRYARKMMAFLLFVPRPRHVVIVGLGGGSLTKFCHRQLTRTRVTTVEVNPEVIALGALFDLPRSSARLHTVQADARDYFSNSGELADVVLMDGCDAEGTARELCSEGFYRDVRARLSPQGVLVGNIAGVRARTGDHLRCLSRAFEGRVLTIHLRDCANRLVFAFNDDRMPDWLAVAQRAGRLTLRHGLDFHTYGKRLQHAFTRRGRSAGW